MRVFSFLRFYKHLLKKKEKLNLYIPKAKLRRLVKEGDGSCLLVQKS